MTSVLLIEPFYTGSHRQLMDVLQSEIPGSALVTMSGKKWPWRARTAALHLSQNIPRQHSFRTVFASSVLNMAELIALRPDLASTHKVLYFHENQLTYPVQVHKQRPERDFQFGYNQILSALVSDVVVFNSSYNMETFLGNINSFLKQMQEYRPKHLADQIRDKCRVLHFPIMFPDRDGAVNEKSNVEKGRTKDFCLNSCPVKSNHFESIMSSAEHEEQTCNNNKQSNEGVISDSLSMPCTCIQSDSASKDCMKPRSGLAEHSQPKQEHGSTEEKVLHEMENNFCVNTDTLGTSVELHDDRYSSSAKKMKVEHQFLHIVWPHRWEHDKNPEAFFRVMYQLRDAGCQFRLSVLGEQYTDVPVIFEEANAALKNHIEHWGYQACKEDYYNVLREADVVVSTANHEFFGVAVLEAVHLGCFPLVPNRLVYPELFTKTHLYNTDNQLFKELRNFCNNPHVLRHKQTQLNTEQYSWDVLKSRYLDLFHIT
ncbi:glycosyltransferase-like domain-containing protein 1 isoform X2 [Mya arenaria]|nr:glycosyltransferase-like domain-containing protein 1 isoform X2 [Mya arenaria]XP_052768801.1 glycosyltransferase-like domain-containing protein 1 isoform X2 [Mya arenaria]XP_052768803.1 glycosyltransferase-like domain-containing protein 1 isoform X2 [Mya arenaria]XP_052768804.1 glycosyltransferase-like domain-containing protein 1 isoform X2 [Mya arenaria]